MPRLQASSKIRRRDSFDETLSKCPVPIVECTRRGFQAPSFEEGGVRMYCSNAACAETLNPIHPECFKSLEEALVKYLHTTGSSRRWTDEQLYQNLWIKKGMDIIRRLLKCPCGKGVVDPRKDLRLPETVSPKKVSVNESNETGLKKKHRTKEKPALNLGSNRPDTQAEYFRAVDTYLSKFSDEECEANASKAVGKPVSTKPKSLPNKAEAKKKPPVSKTTVTLKKAKLPESSNVVGMPRTQLSRKFEGNKSAQYVKLTPYAESVRSSSSQLSNIRQDDSNNNKSVKAKAEKTKKPTPFPSKNRTNTFTSSKGSVLFDHKEQSKKKPLERKKKEFKGDQSNYCELQILSRVDEDLLKVSDMTALQSIYDFSKRLRRIEDELTGKEPVVLHPKRISNLTLEEQLKPIERSREQRYWYLYSLTENSNPALSI